MSESEEQVPPEPDLDSWNRGRCHDELDLYPAEVAIVIAVMAAERHGQEATADWILDVTKVACVSMAGLKRRRWVTDYRIKGQKKVWLATERAWRVLGFELKQRKAS